MLSLRCWIPFQKVDNSRIYLMSRKDLFYEKPGIRLKSFEHFFNFTDQ